MSGCYRTDTDLGADKNVVTTTLANTNANAVDVTDFNLNPGQLTVASAIGLPPNGQLRISHAGGRQDTLYYGSISGDNLNLVSGILTVATYVRGVGG